MFALDFVALTPSTMPFLTCTAAASLVAPVPQIEKPVTPVLRCGCDHHAPIDPTAMASFLGSATCGADFNIDDLSYDPANRPLYRVPIVFHLVGTDTAPSAVTPARLDAQMQILNDAFEQAQIEFEVAGVIQHNNSSWTQDIGDYWTSTSVDPLRNVNVYVLKTPMPAPALGYVSDFPFVPGFAGSAADRVVVRELTVGFNTLSPIHPYAAYDEGMTLVHELGHYFGLYHTFETSFDSAVCPGSTATAPDCACLTASPTLTGDLIADTEYSTASASCTPNVVAGAVQCSILWAGTTFVACSHAVATLSACPSTPGARVAWDNFMSYSSDQCITRFTPEQIRRMHCTIDTYRPEIATPVGPVGVTTYCDVVANSTGRIATLAATTTSSTGVLANNLSIVGADVPAQHYFLPIIARDQGYFPDFYPGSPGVLCLAGPFGRLSGQIGLSTATGEISYDIDLAAIPLGTGLVMAMTGETWNTQVWYRDGVVSNTTQGLTIPIR